MTAAGAEARGTRNPRALAAHARKAAEPRGRSQALTEHDVISHLTERGLIAPSLVLDSEVSITRLDRRNQNMQVECSGGPRYFIKRGSRDGETGTVAREARLYAGLQRPQLSAFAARYLPRCHGYDEKAGVLILEGLPYAEDLHAYHPRSRRFPKRVAVELGRALARLHACGREAHSEVFPVFPLPGVFQLTAPPLGILREASAVGLQVIRLVQRNAVLRREFRRLSRSFRRESLVHGDVKLANCVAFRRARHTRITGLKLVDWEFAGIGDPRWDVGSVFAGYLSLWVQSIPIPRSDRPELHMQAARCPLPRVQQTCSAFFETYVEQRALGPKARRSWLLDAVRFAAARLVQTAYEYATSASELSSLVVTLVQLAVNVFEDPERAATDLLGIPVDREENS